jgi:hypothetical protein
MPADSPFKPAWWYRKEFQLLPEWQGKHVWLHLDESTTAPKSG